MISQIFIDRPKLAIVISLVMVLAGILCIFKLPVAEYPEIAPPQIRVSTMYVGASSQVIADTVAAPIEAQINGLDDLLYFSSSSDDSGSYQLQISFKYGADIDMAQVNVQNAIKRAEPVLPVEVKTQGIEVIKMSTDILGVFAFKADPDKMSILKLSNFIRTQIKDELTRVDGVSQTEIFTPYNYSMRIWLDPIRMSAIGISANEVSAAILGQNVQAAAGSVGVESSNDLMQYKINVKGRLKSSEEFSDIIVRNDTDGSIVKLSDISTIELGSESYAGNSLSNGEESVALAVYRNNEANALKTLTSVKKRLVELSKRFPEGVRYELSFDPTEFITISIREIVWTIVLALVLVVLVTWIFLQNWRATIIPTIAIPVSLLGTFPFMLAIGYSINVLTMFGLILVIGSLVDDAIVVVENVMTQLEKGTPVKQAVETGMRQITGAVIATTLVTLAIYIPVCFYGGMVGQIYIQFAVTMCIALLLSTVNALTLSPALCVMFLHPPKKKRFSFFAPFNWGLELSKKVYLSFAGILVRRSILTLILFAGIFYANYKIYGSLPSSFLPQEDKGALMCDIELAPGASLTRTRKAMNEFAAKMETIPGVDSILVISGFSMLGGMSENVGFGIIKMKTWNERKTPELQLAKIQEQAQRLCNEIPEARIRCMVPPAIMGLGAAGGASFALCGTGEVSASDLSDQLRSFNMEVMKNPATIFSASSYNADTPQLRLEIDREKAETLGVPISQIFSTLQSKLASYYVNDFNLLGYVFKVKIQSNAEDRGILEDIYNIYIPNVYGDMVPFSSLAEVVFENGPRRIQRFNQMISADVMAQANPMVSTGDYMKFVENIPLPPDYHVEWTGASYQEKQNQGQILLLLSLAFVFGYLFLVAQYESWTTPIPVLVSVAVAILGALIGQILGAKYLGIVPMSIYAQLGLVMLIGLASKNAILMVEFSKVDHEVNGVDVNQAALNGASQRFRAVLMTALSFVFGVFPLVIATGAGAGSRRAIGMTTFSGMVLATFVGIVFVPALYAMVQKTREFTARCFSRKK